MGKNEDEWRVKTCFGVPFEFLGASHGVEGTKATQEIPPQGTYPKWVSKVE